MFQFLRACGIINKGKFFMIIIEWITTSLLNVSKYNSYTGSSLLIISL